MAHPTGMDVFTTRLGAALRAPLGRIIANADSISAEPDGPVNETYAGYAADIATAGRHLLGLVDDRSEEHTSELQSLMRISYAVFCLKKKKPKTTIENIRTPIQPVNNY